MQRCTEGCLFNRIQKGLSMNTMTGRRGAIWKTPSITADGLKLFACAVMLIQTAGIAVVENGIIQIDQYTQEGLSTALAENSGLMVWAGIGSVMQLIGGMALPVFAFLLVEGFRNTSNIRRYVASVLIFALVSEIPYDLAVCGELWSFSTQNALVSMLICLLMLCCLHAVEMKKGIPAALVKFCIVLGAVLWVTLLRAQYGLCLVLLTAVFDLFYARNVLKTVLGILISLMYVTGPLAFYGLWCYNGKRKNRIHKYVYYAFYPAHLFVLGLIAQLLKSL